MTHITLDNISDSEFVYLISSTPKRLYYYLEITPTIGIMVTFQDNKFKTDLCMSSSIPRNSKSITLSGIRHIEEIQNIAKYLGYNDDIF